MRKIDYLQAISARVFRKKILRFIHSLFFSYVLTEKHRITQKYQFFDTTPLKNRSDYKTLVNSFREKLIFETGDDCDIVSVSYKFNIKYTCSQIIYLIACLLLLNRNFYELILIRQLKDLERNLNERYHGSISNVITFCDAHPEDSVIAQYFNSLEIPTYTLQHGWYKRGMSSLNKLVVENFCSKFIFSWGNHFDKDLIDAGISRENIKMLGYYKPLLKIKNNKLSNRIIFLLSGREESNLNKELIKIGEEVRRRTDYDIVYRRHPDDTETYDCDKNRFSCACLEDDLNLSLLSVICTGSVRIDMEHADYIFFHINIDKIDRINMKIKDESIIDTANELIDFVDDIKLDSYRGSRT